MYVSATPSLSTNDWEQFVQGFRREMSYLLNPSTWQERARTLRNGLQPERQALLDTLEEETLVLLDYLLERDWLQMSTLARARQRDGWPSYIGECLARAFLQEPTDESPPEELWILSSVVTLTDWWMRPRTPDQWKKSSLHAETTAVYVPVDQVLYDQETLRSMLRQPEALTWKPLSTCPRDRAVFLLIWGCDRPVAQGCYSEGVFLTNMSNLRADRRFRAFLDGYKTLQEVS
jgi:hypothetical protein